MPALNFSERFAPLVESGVKRQTVRKRGKRRFPYCSVLYFFTGQRTKKCRRLGEATCAGVYSLIITEDEILVRGVKVDAEEFAKKDGFESFEAFKAFFRPLPRNDLIMITWDRIEGERENVS